MRKLVLIALIALLPVLAFSMNFSIGAAAVLNLPISPSTVTDVAVNTLGVDDLSFGADVRLRLLGILEVSGLALVSLPEAYFDEVNLTYSYVPASLDIYTDVGLGFKLAFFGLGVGVGPNIIVTIADENGNTGGAMVGFNAKAHADVYIGPIEVSLSYIALMPELSRDAFENLAANLTGNLALSVMFAF